MAAFIAKKGKITVCDTREPKTSEKLGNQHHNNVVGLTKLGKKKKSPEVTVLCSAQPSPPGTAGDALGCSMQLNRGFRDRKATLNLSCLAFVNAVKSLTRT